MELIRKNLTLILLVAACAAGVIVYQSYFSGGTPDVLVSDGTNVGPDAGQFLQSLGGLKSVNLDPALFSDPVFLSLVDFGINIPPEPVGRSNPFAPLGSGGTQTGNAGITPVTVKSAH